MLTCTTCVRARARCAPRNFTFLARNVRHKSFETREKKRATHSHTHTRNKRKKAYKRPKQQESHKKKRNTNASAVNDNSVLETYRTMRSTILTMCLCACVRVYWMMADVCLTHICGIPYSLVIWHYPLHCIAINLSWNLYFFMKIFLNFIHEWRDVCKL